ncbi:uncharacterized protein LOC123920516 [Trifolium pratense]|uniref:uncharacterized protein LOC123920516 n=1 Tax=Trifolium pratense TaxID=57577 RepID=UPI001E690D0E|nr:uncharacterized protein LOC123920516 [Trifolium pratense]
MEFSSKLDDAFAFLKRVEVSFQRNRIKYEVFREILKDYKAGKIDIGGMKVRVKGLFKDHKKLISEFNTFLPKEHQITAKFEFEDGSAFYKAVKDAFQDKSENFDVFLNLMMDWKYERVDIRSFVAQMKELLKEHTDLTLGFNIFLPTKYQITIPSQPGVSETIGNKFKGDGSHVRCSNNHEYYAIVSECKDDFKKKRSKRSKRLDFSSILEDGILESKNREDVVVCGCNEGFEKLTPKKRRISNTSHRVEFQILDTDETSSSDEGSKKKITKREAKDERSNKPSKKCKINNNNNDNDQLQEQRPELPLVFKEKIEQMQGSDVMLVIQKKLTKSDVEENNGRLSIPENQVINENFLEPNEKSSLDYDRKEGRKKRIGMSVSVLDPSLNLYNGMCFKKWKMGKSEIYNITGEWNELVENNHLEKDQKVQVWSFRSHHQLCFALVKL